MITEHVSRTDVFLAILLGAAFFVVFIGTALYLVSSEKGVPRVAEFLFRTVLALTGAGFAAILPGFFEIQGQILEMSLRAGGALAVLLLIYYFNPRSLQDSPGGNNTSDTDASNAQLPTGAPAPEGQEATGQAAECGPQSSPGRAAAVTKTPDRKNEQVVALGHGVLHSRRQLFRSPAGWMGIVVFSIALGAVALGKRPDFDPAFFRPNGELFRKIKDEYYPLEVSNASCRKIVYLHYITRDVQVALHAYLGLKSTDGGNGFVTQRVSTAAEGDLPEITYAEWRDASAPSFLTNQAEDGRIRFKLGSQETNIFTLQHYGESVAPDASDLSQTAISDWFITYASEFYRPRRREQTRFVHYVVMPAADRDSWQPARYTFDITPQTKALQFSDLQYDTLATPTIPDAGQGAWPAELRILIEKLNESKGTEDLSASAKKNIIDTKKVLADAGLLEDRVPSKKLVLYRAEDYARPNDLVMIYRYYPR